MKVPISAKRTVEWRYERVSRRYLRRVAGKPAFDVADNTPLSARNVVVLWAHYTPLDGEAGAATAFDVTLGGSGRVSVFRDGQRLDGTWKATGDAPPAFVSDQGAQIALAPGNTWFEVIPQNAAITMR